MRILHVVGARPNFMKVAPVMQAISRRGGAHQYLVHTGQHYDKLMSDCFFEELGLAEPDINLEVGSASHTTQTANIMVRLESVFQEQSPDWVVVYGDVNSTVAAALVCAKLGIRVAHVEAGLRSFDRSMPEEINRIVTDQLADLLFTPSQDGDDNLLREGVEPARICRVGNVMIDTLVRILPLAKQSDVLAKLEDNGFQRGKDGTDGGCFGLVTLHRPSNVDDSDRLMQIFHALEDIAHDLPLIFPVHPRTQARLNMEELNRKRSGVYVTDPYGYIEFLSLVDQATLVITDSGGIQEETTYLGIPCLTFRETTERPITVTKGTNILVGIDPERLKEEAGKLLKGERKKGTIPELWDGRAGERIAEVMLAS